MLPVSEWERSPALELANVERFSHRMEGGRAHEEEPGLNLVKSGGDNLLYMKKCFRANQRLS